jgi:GR25 family glycosyltransferase involved in LPS biosynthesis
MLLNQCYKAFINLPHRTDRLDHMIDEMRRTGITATRYPAIDTTTPNKPIQYPREKVARMLMRTPGAIGCHYSQVGVMETALKRQLHAFVMEDDLIFCRDFLERIAHIEKFLEQREWDVFWLGGTFHVNPCVWHTGRHPDLRGSNIGRDVETTEDPRIVRTYGAFCTYAYIVNQHSIRKIVDLLDQHVHESMGIDWLFIKLQPQLKTYAYVPGCVKQLDNNSDIGRGVTRFSQFSNLGPYWYADYARDFDPEAFDWAEAKINR